MGRKGSLALREIKELKIEEVKRGKEEDKKLTTKR